MIKPDPASGSFRFVFFRNEYPMGNLGKLTLERPARVNPPEGCSYSEVVLQYSACGDDLLPALADVQHLKPKREVEGLVRPHIGVGGAQRSTAADALQDGGCAQAFTAVVGVGGDGFDIPKPALGLVEHTAKSHKITPGRGCCDLKVAPLTIYHLGHRLPATPSVIIHPEELCRYVFCRSTSHRRSQQGR